MKLNWDWDGMLMDLILVSMPRGGGPGGHGAMYDSFSSELPLCLASSSSEGSNSPRPVASRISSSPPS